jgi:hypothetical protein
MKFLFSFLFVLGICCPKNSFAYTPCTLPAPKNLQVLNQTPTNLRVRWDAVPDAIGYEVECKNANNEIVPVQSFCSPTSASFNIEPNMDYTVTTRSIYSNCEVGGEVSCLSVVGPTVLIVVDLLAGTGDEVIIPSNLVYSSPAPPIGSTPVNTELIPDRRYYYEFNATGWGLGLIKGMMSQENSEGYVHWRKISPLSWNLIGIESELNGYIEVSHEAPGGQTSFIPDYLGIKFSYNESGQLQFRASGISNLKIYEIVSIVENPGTGGSGSEGGEGGIPGTGGGGTGGSEGENPVKEHSSSDQPTGNTPVIIAPNPCTDHLNVLLPQAPESQVTVKIFDITGKLQQTTSLLPSDITYRAFEVNTNELRPGIYIMQIDNGSKEITTHKLVKI